MWTGTRVRRLVVERGHGTDVYGGSRSGTSQVIGWGEAGWSRLGFWKGCPLQHHFYGIYTTDTVRLYGCIGGFQPKVHLILIDVISHIYSRSPFG